MQLEEHKKFRNLGGETASLQVATVAQPVASSTSEIDSLRQLIEKMGADTNELRQQMKGESSKRQKVEKELQEQLEEESNKRQKVEKELQEQLEEESNKRQKVESRLGEDCSRFG